MATLTQVAVKTRKIIKYSIYLVIFLIITRFAWGIGKGIYRNIFPKPPPPPTLAFGKLSKIPFPENKDLPPTLEYQVDTVEGSLPALDSQGTVYFMPRLSANLLSLEAAQEKTAKLGFSAPGEEISSSLYRFKKKGTSASLEMNIITGVFSISYDLSQDPSPLASIPPAPEVAASQVRSFLSSAGLLPEDLQGPSTPEFLKVEGGNLVSVLSLSEANLVRVNLFRKNYNNLPAVTANPQRANVWFLVSGDRSRDKQIIGGEFHYSPVNEEQWATYPLKTSQQAFEALKASEGYIASLGQNTDGKVTIRKIYLAYFDPPAQAQFYQPVFVFVGDRGFVAYVPAVTPEYYGS